MDNEEQHNEMENAESQLHPLIEQFVDSAKAYFQKMDSFSDQWDDSASFKFKEQVVSHCRKATYEYLQALVLLSNGYELILQQADDHHMGTYSRIKDGSVFNQMIDATNTFIAECDERIEKINDKISIMDEKMQKIKDLRAQRLYDAKIEFHNCVNTRTEREVDYAQKSMDHMDELTCKAYHLVNQYKEAEEKFLMLLDISLQDSNDYLKRLDKLFKDYKNETLNLNL